MLWFKHDSDALTDSKIKKLIIRYGVTGYAIYFHCLELIARDISETHITFELEHDAEIIADDLKIQGTKDLSSIELVNTIMKYIVELGLFDESNNHIFCFKMLKRLDTSMTSNVKFRKIIVEAKKNHDSIMIPSCKIRLDEMRLDEMRKEENSDIPESQASPSPLHTDSSADSTLFDGSDNAQDGIKDTVSPAQVGKKVFRKPTVDEVRAYCVERGNSIDPEYFVNYNESRGWVVGRLPMKEWRAAIRTWEKREKDYASSGGNGQGLRNAAKSDRYDLGSMVNQ